MRLLELVYEGGRVIDLALAAQRELLAAELGAEFASFDMRGQPTKDRSRLLQHLATTPTSKLLVRGISGVREAAKFFQRSRLFIDALGRSEIPTRSSLALYAYRTERAFVYGMAMEEAVREAGVEAVSRHQGPFFPRLDLDPPRPPRDRDRGLYTVGVLSLGFGALEVIGKLKHFQEQKRGVPFAIACTERVSGTTQCDSALDVAEQSDLLMCPNDQEDRLGPDEGSVVALCVGRAVCAARTDGFSTLPYEPGRYISAARYAPGSYAAGTLQYWDQRVALNSWPGQQVLAWDTVPREVIRRL